MSSNDFRIKIAEIGETELELERPIERAWFEEALAGVDLCLVEGAPATATLHLAKSGRDVVVRGELSGSAVTSCARCLEDAAVDLTTEFDVLFRGDRGKQDDDDEDALLDVALHDGVVVDVSDPIREYIILSIPITPLCREDCRGLCDQCGQNLNEAPCEHRPDAAGVVGRA